jgi:hypothetical protein
LKAGIERLVDLDRFAEDSPLEEGGFELVVSHAMATVSETVSLAWVKGTGIMPEN